MLENPRRPWSCRSCTNSQGHSSSSSSSSSTVHKAGHSRCSGEHWWNQSIAPSWGNLQTWTGHLLLRHPGQAQPRRVTRAALATLLGRQPWAVRVVQHSSNNSSSSSSSSRVSKHLSLQAHGSSSSWRHQGAWRQPHWALQLLPPVAGATGVWWPMCNST
jgi:hypothetical protein